MNVITLQDYWMGRDIAHPPGADIVRNAERLLFQVNNLLARMPAKLTREGVRVASGYRPPAINAATPGAARRSLHMTGMAIDLDDDDGSLDDWCLDHQTDLVACGLYMEHPAATKGWCHLQAQAPRSGKRVFYP